MELLINHNASSNLKHRRAIIEKEYRAIKSGAGLHVKNRGVLKLKGKDSLDFLHRLSTNDIKSLQPGHIIQTVLTTEKARIVDVVTVCHGGSFLTLLTSSNNAASVKGWLEKYIIMEELELLDVSTQTTVLTVMGVGAEHLLLRFVNGSALGDARTLVAARIAEREVRMYRDPRWILPSFEIMFDTLSCASISELLSGIIPILSHDTIEMMRIEEGIPEYGTEITEHVNPLEANLHHLVSFTKGCYIGQEVIARLDTYKKLGRRLSGFVFDQTDCTHTPPGILYEGGIEIGWTTSHTYSIEMQRWIGLGFLKGGRETSRVELQPAGSNERYAARTCKLPFPPGKYLPLETI